MHIIKEFREFCKISSAHGVVYFFSDFSFIVRGCWIVITVVMAIAGLIWVSNVTTEWSKNPTVLVTETISGPIETVQFPSITICNSFDADKWAFMRNLMNLIKFRCNNDQECIETRQARNFAKMNNYGCPPDCNTEFPLMRKTQFNFARDLGPNGNIGWTLGISTIGSRNYRLLEDAIHTLYLNEQDRMVFMVESLRKKLTCKIGNFAFFNHLNVSPRFTDDIIFGDGDNILVKTIN